MKYIRLAELYEKLVNTTKRLEKTDIISEFLKKIPEDEIEDVINLISGRIFPLWDSRKIGFSSKLLIKTINASTGTSVNEIEKELNTLGDLGDVTAKLIKTKTQKTLFQQQLTVKKVVENLKKLASMEGQGSTDKKIGLVAELLSSAKPEEAKYISRTVLEVLRVGIADGIIKDAIAKAFDKNVMDINNAFDILADHGEVALHAKQNSLDKIFIKPGRPIKLMLAVLSKNTEEAFENVGKPAVLEYKYDGFRISVHKSKSGIKLFTRNMEDVTKQFPDIIENAKKHIAGHEYILDCEAVGYSPKTGKYLPFQSISQRIKRKYDTEKMAQRFPVELKIFDVIYYDKKIMINEEFEKRRKLLEKIITEKEKKIKLSNMVITEDTKKAELFFKKSIKEGHEGLMFKALNAKYRPGRYVGYMTKLKEVMDSLDLVVVKAEWGEGKRVSWLTSYTVACQDNDKFLEVGKVSTGLKEKPEEGETGSFENITNQLKDLIIFEKGKEVTVKPQIIVEVSYEEIQRSQIYTSGYALRFPRIIKIRNDKPLNEISKVEDVKKLFEGQNK